MLRIAFSYAVGEFLFGLCLLGLFPRPGRGVNHVGFVTCGYGRQDRNGYWQYGVGSVERYHVQETT